MYSILLSISYGLVKNQNPRKGTETFASTNACAKSFFAVKNQNPRKGTETAISDLQVYYSKWVKNQNPRKGTETVMEPGAVLVTLHIIVKNQNPRKGTENLIWNGECI